LYQKQGDSCIQKKRASKGSEAISRVLSSPSDLVEYLSFIWDRCHHLPRCDLPSDWGEQPS